jgi:hypothetical protein
MTHRKAALAVIATLGCGLIFTPQVSRSAPPDAPTELKIVSAFYGRPGADHPYDFSTRLQETCGDHSTTCEIFCSAEQLGRARSGLLKLPFRTPPVCRVVFHCGAETTLTSESEDGEVLHLSCKRAH